MFALAATEAKNKDKPAEKNASVTAGDS